MAKDFLKNMKFEQTDHHIWNTDSIDGQVGPSREKLKSVEDIVALTAISSQPRGVMVEDVPAPAVAVRVDIGRTTCPVESYENINDLVLKSQKELAFQETKQVINAKQRTIGAWRVR